MAHTVRCIKLGRDLPGMDFPPFGGALGTKLWQQVSAEGWAGYMEHFKRIMNEMHLAGGTPEATKIFMKEAENYFYGEASAAPANYKPEGG